jgi:carbon monoxide dehydrogenase subunit G
MKLDHVTEEIKAPIAKVWALLADLGGVGRLFPAEGIPGFPSIERVTMKGEGLGSIRTVRLAGGVEIHEQFEVIDPASLTIVYTGLAPMPLPVENYRATILLTALEPALTRVDWSSTGTPVGASAEDLRRVLEPLHRTLIDGARKLSEA